MLLDLLEKQKAVMLRRPYSFYQHARSPTLLEARVCVSQIRNIAEMGRNESKSDINQRKHDRVYPVTCVPIFLNVQT